MFRLLAKSTTKGSHSPQSHSISALIEREVTQLGLSLKRRKKKLSPLLSILIGKGSTFLGSPISLASTEVHSRRVSINTVKGEVRKCFQSHTDDRNVKVRSIKRKPSARSQQGKTLKKLLGEGRMRLRNKKRVGQPCLVTPSGETQLW